MAEIHKKMLAEVKDKVVFHEALQRGLTYIDSVLERNVYPTDEALDNLNQFDESMPEEPSSAMDVIRKLDHYGSPATVAQIGGRYFGFVNGSVVPSGLSAKLLASFWDQNTAMYVISPIAAKLETVVQQWLKSLFGLPEQTVAGFVSGTSAANLCGLAAARFRVLKNQGWDINQRGFHGAPPIRIITSKEAHSTVIKALGLLGFGYNLIEFVETDSQGRIRADLIPELDDKSILILAAGNVNSGSFDNFSEICLTARKADAWIHIDGAFGLWASGTKKLSHLTRGIEQANSWAVDGHKTLNTPYDCGIVLCSDKEALTSALHMSAGYLVLSDTRDGMFYTPEMSRRARIIELWATLKYLGTVGIDQMVYEMHERAKQFAAELSGIDGFTVMNEVVFNQVIVVCESDSLTEKVLGFIQQDRVCWVGGSTWKGKKVIRISVCSWATTEQDVSVSVHSFKSCLDKALGKE
ncbi:MAG: aspartate aminotransferase family protein [Cyclobacteriaceae bacterium]|nr:aspartate aminotransferase family protein [Cyclobacteriaceae bacterium]